MLHYNAVLLCVTCVQLAVSSNNNNNMMMMLDFEKS